MLIACAAAAHPLIKDSTTGVVVEGRLLFEWMCKGWASNKHTETLSPAKAGIRAGLVPPQDIMDDMFAHSSFQKKARLLNFS